MTANQYTVRDIMKSEVVTLSQDDALDLAHDIMTLGRIRHMPVVSAGHLVGLITQRDLFRAAISSVLQFTPGSEREWLGKIQVREVMTTDVLTATPDTGVKEAVALMLRKRIGCLPVVDPDDGGHITGLVSETDCLELLERLIEQQ